MSVVRAWTFATPLTIDAARAALEGQHGYVWSIRESEYDGRYVLGRAADGTRIRVLFDDDVTPTLELYFPPDLGDDQRDAFAIDLVERVLPTLHASAVHQAR